MKKIKIGSWLYVPTNETVIFCGKDYRGYEVDLERKTILEWLYHLNGKIAFKTQDLHDLWEILQIIKDIKPKLPIYCNKYEDWFANGLSKKPIEYFLTKVDD